MSNSRLSGNYTTLTLQRYEKFNCQPNSFSEPQLSFNGIRTIISQAQCVCRQNALVSFGEIYVPSGEKLFSSDRIYFPSTGIFVASRLTTNDPVVY